MEEELEKEEVANYIQNHIDSAMLTKTKSNNANAKYHHSTSYALAPSIIKYGFLSAIDQQANGISSYSGYVMEKVLKDDYHVNDNDGISFAVMNLKDLYPGEMEYDPMIPTCVDFVVDIPWPLIRNTENYGNEFISELAVDSKYIRYLDLRIKELIIEKLQRQDYEGVVARYNSIIRIAHAIKKYNNDIILREVSNQREHYLDHEKIGHYANIKIKK